MRRIDEIKLMIGTPEWKRLELNVEVKKDYEEMMSCISQLEKEADRLRRENEKYRVALSDAVATRVDKKEEKPEKNDNILKRLKG